MIHLQNDSIKLDFLLVTGSCMVLVSRWSTQYFSYFSSAFKQSSCQNLGGLSTEVKEELSRHNCSQWSGSCSSSCPIEETVLKRLSMTTWNCAVIARSQVQYQWSITCRRYSSQQAFLDVNVAPILTVSDPVEALDQEQRLGVPKHANPWDDGEATYH